MSAPIQKGTACLVGFNGHTVTGYFMETVNRKPTADVEEVRNNDDESITKIISNPGKEFSGSMVVLNSTDPDTVKIGDTISINSINCMVTAWDVQFIRKAARVNFTAVKEDSMTYS